MQSKKITWVLIPFLIALFVITGQYIYAVFSNEATPSVTNGVLDLKGWNQMGVFEIAGQWKFYWNNLLTETHIQSGGIPSIYVKAPSGWNHYEIDNKQLPNHGFATYCVHVTGIQEGQRYGVILESTSSAYRLYENEVLIAQNGSFGDDASAPMLAYQPQCVGFNPNSNSFDLIMQVSNYAYAGGMYEPIIFGMYDQVAAFNSTLSDLHIASFAIIITMSVLFLIIFASQRQQRDLLIWAGFGLATLLQLAIIGYSSLSLIYLFPYMPIAYLGRFEYMSNIWIQFLFMYFVYCNYSTRMRKWHIAALLSYAFVLTLLVLLLPFESISVAYQLVEYSVFLVVLIVTLILGRATWQGQPDSAGVFGVLSYILLSDVYYMCVTDYSIANYLFSTPAFLCLVLFFLQFFLVARRYNRAQKTEIAFLKGQIQPHFFNNSLACIISLSRTDPSHTRELLLDMSNYMRGFYDYSSDDLITLKQELEFVHAYVNLQQLRFGERIKVDFQIDSENILLPPLILQPLVENSFIHGLRDKENGGMVTIYAKRIKSRKARIGVIDNGIGIKKSQPVSSRQGIGIENINSRLLRLYRTHLVFTVPAGGGCEVYMEIPWKESNNDKNISH